MADKESKTSGASYSFAYNKEHVRIHISEAESGGKGYACPYCGSAMIAKKGKIKVHHFSHASKADCDPWYRNKGDWHIHMQDMFPKECQEVVIEKNGVRHIADVCLDTSFKNGGKLIIEFQHSSMSYEEFLERSTFYKQDGNELVWVFDLTERMIEKHTQRLDMSGCEDIIKYDWKRPASTFGSESIGSTPILFYAKPDNKEVCFLNVEPERYGRHTEGDDSPIFHCFEASRVDFSKYIDSIIHDSEWNPIPYCECECEFLLEMENRSEFEQFRAKTYAVRLLEYYHPYKDIPVYCHIKEEGLTYKCWLNDKPFSGEKEYTRKDWKVSHYIPKAYMARYLADQEGCGKLRVLNRKEQDYRELVQNSVTLDPKTFLPQKAPYTGNIISNEEVSSRNICFNNCFEAEWAFLFDRLGIKWKYSAKWKQPNGEILRGIFYFPESGQYFFVPTKTEDEYKLRKYAVYYAGVRKRKKESFLQYPVVIGSRSGYGDSICKAINLYPKVDKKTGEVDYAAEIDNDCCLCFCKKCKSFWFRGSDGDWSCQNQKCKTDDEQEREYVDVQKLWKEGPYSLPKDYALINGYTQMKRSRVMSSVPWTYVKSEDTSTYLREDAPAIYEKYPKSQNEAFVELSMLFSDTLEFVKSGGNIDLDTRSPLPYPNLRIAIVNDDRKELDIDNIIFNSPTDLKIHQMKKLEYYRSDCGIILHAEILIDDLKRRKRRTLNIGPVEFSTGDIKECMTIPLAVDPYTRKCLGSRKMEEFVFWAARLWNGIQWATDPEELNKHMTKQNIYSVA